MFFYFFIFCTGEVVSHLVFWRWRVLCSIREWTGIYRWAVIIVKCQMAAHSVEVVGPLSLMLQVWKTSFHLLKCDIGMVLYVEEWEYLSFHSHCHNLHLPGQVPIQKCHLGWSWSNQIIFFLISFLMAGQSGCRRRLCKTIQWHYCGFEDQGLPSKIVVLQLLCSTWSIL